MRPMLIPQLILTSLLVSPALTVLYIQVLKEMPTDLAEYSLASQSLLLVGVLFMRLCLAKQTSP
ncbi:UNVERIFIED_CONTAM: hypothetical protein GTU68_040859 [Idotea baltica]|nr:hypothetical protein [Idotea baltica]